MSTRYDWLIKAVSRKHDYQTARNSISLDFDTSPPASSREIDGCEKLIGVRLPPSYRDFLRTWNGFTFIRYDHIDDSCKVPITVHVFGTEKLVTEAGAWKKERRGGHEYLLQFIFLNEGNMLLFDRRSISEDGEYPVVNVEWESDIVALSFEEWIRNFFTAFLQFYQ